MNETAKPRWLRIIGVGDDGLEGLSPRSRLCLDVAEVLVGGTRHLAMVPDDGRRRILWPRPLKLAFDEIAALAPRPVAVLATGDPMWFGVGNSLARRFGAQDIEVLPALSAFSLASSRLLWSLGDVVCLSLHGRAASPLELHIAPGTRILILSRDGVTPGLVAERLKARGYGASTMAVLEHMGGLAERIRTTSADLYAMEDVTDLNVVAVTCLPGRAAGLRSTAPGLADDVFENDGQITRCEVRAVTLARLMPFPGQTLWDIGAGSGAISIEWLRSAPGSMAFAIESHGGRAETVSRNAEALGVPQLKLITGKAPEVLAHLPDPDAVFIGGGLAGIGEPMITTTLARLRPGGRLVGNAVTVESEAILLQAQDCFGGDLTRIAIARTEPLGRFRGWRPLKPVTQWSYQKPWEGA